MLILRSAIAALIMLVTFSCGQRDGKVSEVQLEEIEKAEDGRGFAAPSADTTTLPVADKFVPGARVGRDWDKKIIKNGNLEIEVKNYQRYNEMLHELVRKWEGYIASEQQNSSDYKIENVLTIRIPVQHFDAVVDGMSGMEGKLLVKQINAQDVTGEWLDVRARMEARRRVRLRYLDMLEKAKNIEEVLQVEREINAMQEQIEAAEGRVNYLSHASAYSTLEVRFFEVVGTGGVSFGSRILEAVNSGVEMMKEIVLAVIGFWPLWVGGLLGWVVVRRVYGFVKK